MIAKEMPDWSTRFNKRFYQKLNLSKIEIKSDITLLGGNNIGELLVMMAPFSKTIFSYETDFDIYKRQLEFASKSVKIINDDIIKAYPTHIMDIDLMRTVKTEHERLFVLFHRQKRLSGIKYFMGTVSIRGTDCKADTIGFIQSLSKDVTYDTYKDGCNMLTFMIKH